MSGLVASEIRKLGTVRTTWVLTAVGLALVALSGSLILFGPVGGPFQGSDVEVASVVRQVGGNSIIILIVAILASTTEFRHGTIGRTLQLTPSRTRVLVAKLVTAALYAIAFFVTGVVLSGVLVAVAVVRRDVALDLGPETVTALWQGPAGLALTAFLGVAVGALLRSQVIAITVTLVWLFIAETLVSGLAPSAGRWLPFQALNAVFLPDDALANIPEGRLVPLDPALALLTFLAYVVMAVAAASALMRHRDV